MLRKKQYTSLLLLVLFIFIKTAGLHTILHSDDDLHSKECDLCEFVVVSNNTPFTASEQISFEEPVQHNYNKHIFYEYSFQFVQDQIEISLFSRPPPIV